MALTALALPVHGVLAAPDGPGIPMAGERPAVEKHIYQEEIDAGQIRLEELIRHGGLLFNASFNILDGQGRPASTGTGAPRVADQPAFIRTSAPDSNSCAGCHNQPRSGGAGDFVANVFVLAQALDPVTSSVGPEQSNERNTLGMFGAGPIEMLAREMSADLAAIRETARLRAVATGSPVSLPLHSKGVAFGTITVLPDGRVDPTGIEGVDWDLIVKPFHQKGAVVSLREFTNNAMNHHHGMQSVERFGAGVDPDDDGVEDELTIGDMTAASIWQATRSVPGRLLPRDQAGRAAVRRGEALFGEIGCGSCHRRALILSSPLFTEPSPFNPPGNLRPEDVERVFAFDMTRQGPMPRLERGHDGRVRVEAFTDLKRHDLNDADLSFFANEQVPQGTLAGFASPASFTVPPAPRPTRQFLTRKLWDVGNSAPYGHRGDLTTLTEAIHYHGGEARATREAFFALGEPERAAIIAFLRSLRVLPEGSPRVALEDGPGSRPDPRPRGRALRLDPADGR